MISYCADANFSWNVLVPGKTPFIYIVLLVATVRGIQLMIKNDLTTYRP